MMENEMKQALTVCIAGYHLLQYHGCLHKFKIPPSTLETLLGHLEFGYARSGSFLIGFAKSRSNQSLDSNYIWSKCGLD